MLAHSLEIAMLNFASFSSDSSLFESWKDSRRIQAQIYLGPERVGVLDHKPMFVELRWVGCNKARESLACGVDHEQIAIWPVIPSEANVAAH